MFIVWPRHTAGIIFIVYENYIFVLAKNNLFWCDDSISFLQEILLFGFESIPDRLAIVFLFPALRLQVGFPQFPIRFEEKNI